ncbi:hypothetical protein [Roseivirga sp.]|uniref:hypothetical protein n=1 Tax=Roseivirga sp. TaxID=1964215 RepID=UPI003B52C6B2
MKASVQYNDFKGTVAADISDFLGGPSNGDDLRSIGKYFNLNEDRFTIVGLSVYGTTNFYVSLICVDKERSSEEKEHIVSMSYDIENEREILGILFKRLHIVLHDRYDSKYPSLEYDEEVRFSDFHETEED